MVIRRKFTEHPNGLRFYRTEPGKVRVGCEFPALLFGDNGTCITSQGQLDEAKALFDTRLVATGVQIDSPPEPCAMHLAWNFTEPDGVGVMAAYRLVRHPQARAEPLPLKGGRELVFQDSRGFALVFYVKGAGVLRCELRLRGGALRERISIGKAMNFDHLRTVYHKELSRLPQAELPPDTGGKLSTPQCAAKVRDRYPAAAALFMLWYCHKRDPKTTRDIKRRYSAAAIATHGWAWGDQFPADGPLPAPPTVAARIRRRARSGACPGGLPVPTPKSIKAYAAFDPAGR